LALAAVTLRKTTTWSLSIPAVLVPKGYSIQKAYRESETNNSL
jgi:hypothetical protein